MTASKNKRPERALVIVESPTKASTIRKYLGDGFEVEASVGHVRDLVTKRADMAESDVRRGAGWVKYGVNIDNGFEPLEEVYRVPQQKKRQIDTLKRSLADADALYLATDDDREGESISWHLLEELKPKVPVYRLVFREITKRAIQGALENPRTLDMDLVNAQRARRVVDRLFGWDVSQVLWRKIKPGLSAGRVQSVALRMLVSRETERIAFSSSVYWDLEAKLLAGTATFGATLQRVGEQRIVAGRDFDATTGIRKSADTLLLDDAAAAALLLRLQGAAVRVATLEIKPLTRKPAAPFTTSTLQQEANRKLRMSAQQTMRVAQALYEKGLISYMRTDSTRLADEAVAAAALAVTERFGAARLAPDGPRVYETRTAGAQEAHEAIRPAGDRFAAPDELSGDVSDQERRLYDLIWRRTLASQMADAQLEQTTVDLAVEPAQGLPATFRASGRTVRVDGFLAVMSAIDEDSDERKLPILAVGDVLQWADPGALLANEHRTRPPARLNDASLVRSLEENGVGRPSTYAAIIQGLLDRGYCFRRGNALVPTFMGMAVTRMLERWMPHLVDYAFTALMENQLDAIARGEEVSGRYLQGFYRDGFDQGDTHIPGLTGLLDSVRDQIDPAEASGVPIGDIDGDPVVVRIGRYGTFVKIGDRTASVPDETAPDELTPAKALELVDAKERGDAPLGRNDDGVDVFLRNGRYGWYLQLGAKGEGDERPKIVSLSKGMAPESVDLALAMRQLALPRTLGTHPRTSQVVEACVGRYGDYLRMGEETRTLPLGTMAIDARAEAAFAILDRPRSRSGNEMVREIGLRTSDSAMISLWQGRWGLYLTDGKNNFNLRDEDPNAVDVEKATAWLAKAAEEKAGRLVGVNPENQAEVRVMRGPFGHYLTDGAINASLPRGLEPDEVDLAFALVRMAEYGKPVKAKKGAGKRKAAGTSVATDSGKAPPKAKAPRKAKAEREIEAEAGAEAATGSKAKTPSKAKAPRKAKTGPKPAAKAKAPLKGGLAAMPKPAPVAPPPAPLPPSRSGTRRPGSSRGTDA